MPLNVTDMHDPSRQYLLVAGGDGYETRIVSGPDLDDAWIGLQYWPHSDCPPDVRAAILDALHDEDRWQQCYALGVTRYEEHFEDGYAEVILLAPNAKVRGPEAALSPEAPLERRVVRHYRRTTKTDFYTRRKLKWQT